VLVGHRVRERRKKARVALLNQVRGLLAERGVVCGQGVATLRATLAATIAQAPTEEVSAGFIAMLLELQAEWRALDQQVDAAERQIRQHARTTPACVRLQKVPGVGPITASAVLAMAGDGSAFRNGRQFAAWVGVTPKEHASGEKRRLGGITKRGDAYLRSLLIHGARAVVRTATRDTPYERWIRALVERRGHNKAVVAVANKNARIVWALLASGQAYRAAPAA
jgi:transposase